MRKQHSARHPEMRDHGGEPFILNIEQATLMNKNFRTTIYTGGDMQLTLMSVPVCGDIGIEMHSDVDQFIRIAFGKARVYMGACQGNLKDMGYVSSSDAILIPAGTWHNIENVGRCPLKLYSLYAPPKHPFGTVHRTKADAMHEGH